MRAEPRDVQRLVIRGFRAGALAAICVAEFALLHWVTLGLGLPRLGPLTALVVLCALAVLNATWAARSRPHRGESASLMFGRAFLAKTLSTLACGGLAAACFAGVYGLGPQLGLAPPALDQAALAGGAAAIGLAGACLVYSATLGQRRLIVERLALRVPGWPAPLAPLRIAHVTDLHIGPNLCGTRLRALLDRVQSTAPDLIAITGDVFDYDPAYIEEGCRELSKLYAPHGVLAVLGNHDVYTGADRVADGLARIARIRVLRDERATLEHGGAKLHVIGLEDTGRGLAERTRESAALEALSRTLPDGAASLVLVHRPNHLAQIARLRLPLALAGHTHGGQITVPWPLAHLNIARLTAVATRGRFISGETQLYVSRGLGVGGVSMRFNCPREITIVTVAPGPIDPAGAVRID
jgi:hypothetical protein